MKWWTFWRRETADSDPSARGASDRGSSGLLTGNPDEDVQSLEVLLESIAEVNSSIDLDRVLHDIVAKSLDISQAERGILLLGADPKHLEVRVALTNDGKALGSDVVYSRTLVDRCLTEGTAERSVVQSDQQARELGQSVSDLKLRAVMCAPLIARSKTVGVIYVDSKVLRGEFSERELALFGALSAQLANAIETARLHEDSIEKVRMQKDFEIANKIQQHLLTKLPSEVPGLDVSMRFKARDEASGDTYDFIPLSGDRLVTVVGDVTGHGVGAALLTHAAQSAVRSYFELIDDVAQVAARLNDRLVESVETGNFMSMLLLLIDPHSRTATYVNAGHPGLWLIRDGEVREFDKTGMVLGVVEGQDYPSSTPIQLQSDDLLFLRTDGVEETRGADGSLYGEERLRDYLSGCAGQPAERVLAGLDEDLARFAGGAVQDDDVTIVAIRLLPTAG